MYICLLFKLKFIILKKWKKSKHRSIPISYWNSKSKTTGLEWPRTDYRNWGSLSSRKRRKQSNEWKVESDLETYCIVLQRTGRIYSQQCWERGDRSDCKIAVWRSVGKGLATNRSGNRITKDEQFLIEEWLFVFIFCLYELLVYATIRTL